MNDKKLLLRVDQETIWALKLLGVKLSKQGVKNTSVTNLIRVAISFFLTNPEMRPEAYEPPDKH